MNGKGLWIALSVVAAVVVLGLALLVVRKKPDGSTTADKTASTVVDAGAGCNAPKTLALMPLLSADDPQLIIWATGDVRMELDGELVFAPPDAPKSLKPGPHKLKVDGKREGKEETAFRVLPGKHGFFFASTLPDIGLVIVRTGTICESCDEATGMEDLKHSPREDSASYLIKEAARILRQQKWSDARELLKGVAPKDRKTEAFLTVAAAYYGQANQAPQALEMIETAAKTHPKSGLALLWQGFAQMKEKEKERREKVLLQRWNKLTERFSNLVSRFEPEVRGIVDAHSRRLETLSTAYATAAEKHDLGQQEQLVTSAHEILEQFVDQIRAQRPDDCDFQSKVVAAALQ